MATEPEPAGHGGLGQPRVSSGVGRTKTQGLHVALLRGINLGAKHKLAMRDLVALFEEVGCEDVVTRGNTGNVVFRAGARVAKRVAEDVAAGILERFGFSAPVILRSHAEFASLAQEHPLAAEAEPDKLHVAFLADAPAQDKVAALDPDRSPPDRFVVRGREVYLHCPNGLARTKLSNAWFDSKLATISTVRTWKVVLELVAMTAKA